MELVREVVYRGVTVLMVDYSGIVGVPELRDAVRRANDQVRGYPPTRSLRVLVDCTGLPYSLDRAEILRKSAEENAPYVRARALVGLNRLAQRLVEAFAGLTGRPLRSFEDAESALDWLAEQ